MRKLSLVLLFSILLSPILTGFPRRASAQAGDASTLIAEVNALRASYGQPPYEVDYSLMAAAQAHSEYQAEIGTWTHTGPGGTRPHDRAVAAGYGGGAQVYISENVAMGVDMSPSQVVYQIWQDAIHLETMISSSYRHIGAGVASNGNYVFYTIDVGYIAGSPGAGDNGSPPVGGTPEVGGTTAPTAIAMVPIQLATPRPDGTIIHVVQWGQFLVTLADAYDVPLGDLLALNGINEDTIIYEGDKLLVKVGVVPFGTQETTLEEPVLGTGTATLAGTGGSKTAEGLTPTQRPPTRTATPPSSVALAEASAQGPETQSKSGGGGTKSGANPAIDSPPPKREGPDYLLFAVFGLALSGTALVLVGSALKRA
jgi:hypothetical protein